MKNRIGELKLVIFTAAILISVSIDYRSTKNMEKEPQEKYELNSFEEVEEFYLQNMSDKQKLKSKLIQTVLKIPEEQSDLFALFILNSNEPFFYLGGATYLEIGKFVEPELFKKVCIYLLRNLEKSTDLWFDIQQIGRWVNQDFVPRNSNMNHEEIIESMLNKMMDYFEETHQIEKSR